MTTTITRCPIHDMLDCSPLLNGCSLVIRAHRSEGPPEQPPEPKQLLSVVIDIQGRRYFRWAYDSHTHEPWRMLGAVHADTDETYRWSDLPAVAVISPGVPV